jgi:hypothetical protein
VSQSLFLVQQRAADGMLAAWTAGEAAGPLVEAWRAQCGDCREAMAQIAQRLETDGASADIVYGLDSIDAAHTHGAHGCRHRDRARPQRDAALHTLLSLLIAAAYQDRSIAISPLQPPAAEPQDRRPVR